MTRNLIHHLRPRLHRHHVIQRVRGDLMRDGFPRLQMLLLVILTGASGFIASSILLHASLSEMWLRYLVAFSVAYLTFLALLWLWLRTRAEDYADCPDLSGLQSSGSGSEDARFGGREGDFGGGGASGSFEEPSKHFSAAGDSGSPVGEALGAAAKAEEFAIPLVVLVLAAAIVCSSLFLIYSAPVLFAELLVDGVLSASLYRRLRGLETQHWLKTAIRRTALPFALTAAIFSVTGWGMALYAPEAHSIGDVVSYLKQGGQPALANP